MDDGTGFEGVEVVSFELPGVVPGPSCVFVQEGRYEKIVIVIHRRGLRLGLVSMDQI